MSRLVKSFAAALFIMVIVMLSACDNDPVQSSANRGTIGGQVADAHTGDPVVDVDITCGGQSTVTDEQGMFFLNNIPKGVHTLQGQKDGFIAYSIALYITSETSHTFELAQENFYASISGHVLLGDSDQPMQGVEVSCAVGATITDASGFYRLDSIPRNTYLIQASKHHHVKFTDWVTVDDDIVLNIRMAASSISGYVTNAVDGPVSGALIRADRWSSMTDEDGFYRIDPIPQGTHRLYISHFFYDAISFEVSVLHEERLFDPVIQRTVLDTLYVLEDATVTESEFDGCVDCPEWGQPTANYGTEPRLRLEHFLSSDPGPPPKAQSARSRFLLRLPDLPPTVGVEHLLGAYLVLNPTGESHHPGYMTARRLLPERGLWFENEITWATIPGARQLSYESRTVNTDELYQIDVMPIYSDTADDLRGLLFQKEETGPAARVESIFFWSGEAPDTLLRPRVIVHFTR